MHRGGHTLSLFIVLYSLGDTAEAHKSHSQYTGSQECRRYSLHSFGEIGHIELLSNTCESNHCQGETDSRGYCIDEALEQGIILLDNQNSHTEHTAVRRNQEGGDPGGNLLHDEGEGRSLDRKSVV